MIDKLSKVIHCAHEHNCAIVVQLNNSTYTGMLTGVHHHHRHQISTAPITLRQSLHYIVNVDALINKSLGLKLTTGKCYVKKCILSSFLNIAGLAAAIP